MEAMREIAFSFEDLSINPQKKDEVLRRMAQLINYDSQDELVSFMWVIGKHGGKCSVEMLLSLTSWIIDEYTAWQYLVSYENIVGKDILPDFLEAFDKINFYADKMLAKGDDKIKDALTEFRYKTF